MNFTKKRYSLKTTRKHVTEKGRKESDCAVISNLNSYFWMSNHQISSELSVFCMLNVYCLIGDV